MIKATCLKSGVLFANQIAACLLSYHLRGFFKQDFSTLTYYDYGQATRIVLDCVSFVFKIPFNDVDASERFSYKTPQIGCAD